MLAIKETHVHTSTSIPKTSYLPAFSTSGQAVEVERVAVEEAGVAGNLGLVVARCSPALLVSLLLLLLLSLAQR